MMISGEWGIEGKLITPYSGAYHNQINKMRENKKQRRRIKNKIAKKTKKKQRRRKA